MLPCRNKPSPLHAVALAVVSLLSALCWAEQTTEAVPQTEVVQLAITGPRTWQRLVVDDLDVLKVDQTRYMPALRLADILKGRVEQKQGRTSITFAGGPTARVDRQAGNVTIGDEPAADAIIQISEITGEREIYITTDTARQLTGLPFEWDEANYAYHVQTDRPLLIWQAPERPSLLGIGANLMIPDLPSVHPAAQPSAFSLDYVDVELRLDADLIQPEDVPAGARLSVLRQTLWGQAFGGAYKLRVAQPGWSWDEVKGFHDNWEESDPVRIEHLDWIYQWDRGELGLGDANTGLNDLVFPFLSYTGLRMSGIAGEGWDMSAFRSGFGGVQGGIVRPQRFDGVAPVGSRIELFINNQRIDVDEVISIDPAAPPGYGTWEFEDIRLPPNALNEVRIRVTEPSGVVTQIERQILGTSVLLPKGGWAYLASVGVQRNVEKMAFGGFVAGARLIHGLDDRLTVGVVAAHQQHLHGFFNPESELPVTSNHFGVEAYSMPIDTLLLFGDLAVSATESPDGTARQDVAGFVRGNLHLSADALLQGSVFYYGADYFNGQTATPSDRLGGWVGGRMSSATWLSAEAAAGWLRDNVDHRRAETLSASFQSLAVRSQPHPRISLSYGLDRLAPDFDEPARLLQTLEGQASPIDRLTLTAYWSWGQDVMLEDGAELFDGVNVPSIALGQTAQTRLTARYDLGPGHSIAMHYLRAPFYERASLVHDYRRIERPYLMFHTELGRDRVTDDVFFENRTEWLFDRQGDWRVGLRSRYEEDEWYVGIFLTIEDQWVIHPGGATRTADLSPDPDLYRGLINPDSSGCVIGRVFVDINADGVLDEGEPGLEAVRVIVERLGEAVSNGKGRYVVPRLSPYRDVSVWVDLETVPAIYTPTHGLQIAKLRRRTKTVVNLGVTPSHAITGRIVLAGASASADGVGGLRVQLHREGETEPVAQSITAADGSYFLGDLRPGWYTICVDTKTLPERATLGQIREAIEIRPTADPVEVELRSMVLSTAPETNPVDGRTTEDVEVLLPDLPESDDSTP